MGKQRRSPAEKKLADEILSQVKAGGDEVKFKAAQRYTNAAMKSERFEFSRLRSAHDGLPIRYFRTPGESLTGFLGPPAQEIWKGSTYPLVLDDGRVIRLPGNRRLKLAIEKADCLYQRITITYVGKLFTRFGGHYEKVYRIDAAPFSGEKTTAAGAEAVARAMASAGEK
jgi:hypothetical protein